MPFNRHRLWTLFVQCFFPDAARPLEWLNVLGLIYCARLLYLVPDVFSRPAYSAFDGEPKFWALLMFAVVLTQLVAMWPSLRHAPIMRFLAMAVAAGLWTVLAITFAQGDRINLNTGLCGAIAFVTAVTGVYLGLHEKGD